MIRQLILGYGRDTEVLRITAAATSFWAWYDGDWQAAETVIYTDREADIAPLVAGLPVRFRALTPDVLADWRGPLGFAHRVKLRMLAEIAQQHPADSILYCDSDTCFTAPTGPLLRGLRAGHSLMHEREYSLAEATAVWAEFEPAGQDAPLHQLLSFLEGRTFPLFGAERAFGPASAMWNAGVVGLLPEAAAHLPEITAFSDELYAASRWVMCEQVALSLALQVGTELRPCTPAATIYHYWGQEQKRLMDAQLATFVAGLQPGETAQPATLARIRILTGSWRRAVRAGEARLAARQAFGQGGVLRGAREAAKALLIGSLGFGR